MRNALGQKLELNTPVALVSQGQGWVTIGVGRIHKVSARGNPSILYLDGSKSNAIRRPERLLVISEDEYNSHRDRYVSFRDYEDDYWTSGIANRPRSQYWKSAYSEGKWGGYINHRFVGYINHRFVQDGMEPWYD